MTRRKLFLLLGIVLAALGSVAGVGYRLLQREPVHGGKPRSYWREHLAHVEYQVVLPDGWLQELVWLVSPRNKPRVSRWHAQKSCEAPPGLLGEMLADNDHEFRFRALVALRAHYGRSPEVWELLLRAAHDPDELVRREAVAGLLWFDDNRWTPAMVGAYLELLSDLDPSVRATARGYHPTTEQQGLELVCKGLQQRAKVRTLTADETRVLQGILLPETLRAVGLRLGL
jgi:hypothetical protein